VNSPRALLASLWIAACLAPGWMPGRRGLDACLMLGWAALVAPALGAIAAQHTRGVFAWAVLGWVWAQCALVLAFSERIVPDPACACAVIAALGLCGHALARAFGVRATTLLVISTGLCLLPSIPGWIGEALPPQHSALILDLSPWTWVMEAAGLDWLRHAAIYEPAGALDIDPGLRQAFQPLPTALSMALIALLSAAAAEVLMRRRGSALVR
jgi:hypothetical protein